MVVMSNKGRRRCSGELHMEGMRYHKYFENGMET